MKVYSQWKHSFVPFSIWRTQDFWGVVIMSFTFEFARTDYGKSLHKSMRES